MAMASRFYLRFLLHAVISGLLAVALGAFGAHALQELLAPGRLETWQTAVQYQMFHVVAQILAALLCQHFPANSFFVWAGYSFLAGVLLFSGSLYLLSLSGISVLGFITPFGGVALLAGWLLLAWGLVREAGAAGG